MPLFGKKTQLTVATDRTELVAGEQVRVRADIGELDKRVQAARLELGYANTYVEDDRDSDGDTRQRRRTTDVVVEKHLVERGGGDAAAQVETVFTVPPGAPGSAEGSIAWFVRAVVDRRLAPDANAKQPLTVRVPAEPLAAWAQTPLAPALGCAMEISASSRVVRPGDTITGTLRLRPDGPINARAVRVQLKRVRYDPDRNTDVDDSTQVPLRGEGELAPGAIETFDFAITVPPTAPPSFQAHYNHQHWYLQGVVDVRRAKDPTVSVEVVVHTA